MMIAVRTAAALGAPRGGLLISPRRFSNFSFAAAAAAAAAASASASATPPPAAEPSTNLFVSGLSKRTTTEGLREAFAKFGEVIQARVVTDRVSGYSKGFGFVRYATIEEAAKGIEGMDGKFLDGWVIFAEYARPRTQQQPPPDNNGAPQAFQRY